MCARSGPSAVLSGTTRGAISWGRLLCLAPLPHHRTEIQPSLLPSAFLTPSSQRPTPHSPHHRTSPAAEPGPTDTSTRVERCNRPRVFARGSSAWEVRWEGSEARNAEKGTKGGEERRGLAAQPKRRFQSKPTSHRRTPKTTRSEQGPLRRHPRTAPRALQAHTPLIRHPTHPTTALPRPKSRGPRISPPSGVGNKPGPAPNGEVHA